MIDHDTGTNTLGTAKLLVIVWLDAPWPAGLLALTAAGPTLAYCLYGGHGTLQGGAGASPAGMDGGAAGLPVRVVTGEGVGSARGVARCGIRPELPGRPRPLYLFMMTCARGGRDIWFYRHLGS